MTQAINHQPNVHFGKGHIEVLSEQIKTTGLDIHLDLIQENADAFNKRIQHDKGPDYTIQISAKHTNILQATYRRNTNNNLERMAQLIKDIARPILKPFGVQIANHTSTYTQGENGIGISIPVFMESVIETVRKNLGINQTSLFLSNTDSHEQ